MSVCAYGVQVDRCRTAGDKRIVRGIAMAATETAIRQSASAEARVPWTSSAYVSTPSTNPFAPRRTG